MKRRITKLLMQKVEGLKVFLLILLLVMILEASCCRIPMEYCVEISLGLPTEYDEGVYNSVASVLHHFGRGDIDAVESHYQGLSNSAYITRIDASVTDTIVKVYGHLVSSTYLMGDRYTHNLYTIDSICLDWDNRVTPVEADSICHGKGPVQRCMIALSYDTSNHEIFQRMMSQSPTDTVYIKGLLRMHAQSYGPPECADFLPGLWIESPDDISLTPIIQ